MRGHGDELLLERGNAMEAAIAWRTPRDITAIDAAGAVVPGAKSLEKSGILLRCQTVLEEDYSTTDAIPDSPGEPVDNAMWRWGESAKRGGLPPINIPLEGLVEGLGPHPHLEMAAEREMAWAHAGPHFSATPLSA